MAYVSAAARRPVREVVVVLGAYVAGTFALALAMRTSPGSSWFPVLATLTALIWLIGSGEWRSRPLVRRGDVVPGVILGAGLAGVALALASGGLLGGEVARVADYAAHGPRPLLLPVVVVSAVAEEMLFRGAAVRIVPRHPAVVGTAAYVAAAACTGSAALTLASLIFGSAAAAVRLRRGTLGMPIVMHVAFSLVVLFVLPAVA